jgi:hypothetical protein
MTLTKPAVAAIAIVSLTLGYAIGSPATDEIPTEIGSAVALEAPTTPPSPTPTQSTLAYGDYGTSKTFDTMVDLCESGDLTSCLDLFWESDLDSGYEAYALDNTTREQRDAHYLADVTATQMLSAAWAEFDASDRSDFCDGYALFGLEKTYEMVMDELDTGGVVPTMDEFELFFSGKC